MLLSEKAAAIRPYTAGEQPQDKRYIKLNTNENPFGPSPDAAAALAAVDARLLRLYPDPASTALRRAIAQVEGVDEDWVFVGNGSDEVLAMAFLAYFSGREKPVLFPDITYSFYPVYCALYDIGFLTPAVDKQYAVDPLDYMRGGAGGIVLANPNAPTSLSLTLDKLEAIAAKNADIPVLIDEAYIDFATVAQTAVPLTKRCDNVLVVKTFSKSYGLAGIRCGYAVGNPALLEGLWRIKDSFNSYPVDRVCECVCTAAVLDRAYFADCRKQVLAVRDETIERLRALGCAVLQSETNFLFVTVPGGDGGAAYSFLREKGVLVRYFDKPRLTDKLRVTVGTREDMQAFLAAMAQYKTK